MAGDPTRDFSTLVPVYNEVNGFQQRPNGKPGDAVYATFQWANRIFSQNPCLQWLLALFPSLALAKELRRRK